AQQWEMTLEVHLPQGIGAIVLEALEGAVLVRVLGVNEPMAQQHCVYRAGLRDPTVSLGKQACTNGTRGPTADELGAFARSKLPCAPSRGWACAQACASDPPSRLCLGLGSAPAFCSR